MFCHSRAISQAAAIVATGFFGVLAPALGDSEKQLRISIRDDVDDSEYAKLGEPYEAMGYVRAGNRSCTGTVVRTTDGTIKVITSAHCFDWNFDNASEVLPSDVTFETGLALDGPTIEVTDIHVQKWNSAGGLDLAVITLAEFEPGTGPIPLTVSAEKPLGEEVVIVGYGTHGTGLPPFENLPDELRRAATNTADEFFDDGENIGQIRTDFDHPRDSNFSTMGESMPTALEGTSGSGDSGGPLLYNNKVIGILHGGINPTQFQFSEYGDVSIFAGVFHKENADFLRANNVFVAGTGDATITVAVDSIAQPDQRFIAGGDGTPVKDGTTVQIGSFTPGFDPTSADLMAIGREWLPFGTAQVGEIAGEPGRISGSCSADGTAFANSKIYWWIIETSSGSAPAPNLSDVTAWGLFSSTDPDWVFPTPGSQPPSDTALLSSSEVDQAIHDGDILTDRLTLETVGLLTYSVWADREFPQGLPDNLRARENDLDDDGIINELEWIFGLSPLLPDHSVPLTIGTASSSVTIVYDRSQLLPADSHHFEFSTDLIDWQSITATATTIEGIDENTERASLQFDQTLASRTGYWRLTSSR